MIIIDYVQQCNISIFPPYNSPKGTFDTVSGFRELALLPLMWGILSILCVCVCVCVCVFWRGGGLRAHQYRMICVYLYQNRISTNSEV
jgi:hypothetical protein